MLNLQDAVEICHGHLGVGRHLLGFCVGCKGILAILGFTNPSNLLFEMKSVSVEILTLKLDKFVFEVLPSNHMNKSITWLLSHSNFTENSRINPIIYGPLKQT